MREGEERHARSVATLRAFSADSCSAAMRSARGRRYPGAWRAKGCKGGAQAGCCAFCERRARHTADTHLKPVPMLICSTCARALPPVSPYTRACMTPLISSRAWILSSAITRASSC